MTKYYAFERPIGKLTYIGKSNNITGNMNINGRLFAFSSEEKRTLFIKSCPKNKSRQEIRRRDIRGLFLGISLKELEAYLVTLPIDDTSNYK